MSTPPTCVQYFQSSAWTQMLLQAWWTHFISNSLSKSSQLSYDSAVCSYLYFCNIHGFPIEPTADTLSFYLTFASFFCQTADFVLLSIWHLFLFGTSFPCMPFGSSVFPCYKNSSGYQMTSWISHFS